MSPRGGERKGAGRKALSPEENLTPHTAWLYDHQVNWLTNYGGNLSAGIRKLVDAQRLEQGENRE